MNQIQIIGISHKTVNLNEIGQFHLNEETLQTSLNELKNIFEISELVYLATCNRLEFIFYGKPLCYEQQNQFIQYLKPNETDSFYSIYRPKFFYFNGFDAVKHLFKVSASLESAVIGEGQIFGQLKEAYTKALSMDLTGDYLRILFQNAIEAGKKVYTNTEINRKPVSVASVACKMIQEQVSISEKDVLFIGAGETIQLISKYLYKSTPKRLTVANRTVANAQPIAEMFNGQAISLDELYQQKRSFDIIITCTSSSDPIVTEDRFKHWTNNSSVIITDIAVPNDVENAVKYRDDVQYIHVEDIKKHCEKNSAERKVEVDKALEIIDEFIVKFKQSVRQRRVETAFSEVPKAVKSLHEKELEKIFRTKLKHFNSDDKELVEEFINHLAKKFIQIPMKMAKDVMLDSK